MNGRKMGRKKKFRKQSQGGSDWFWKQRQEFSTIFLWDLVVAFSFYHKGVEGFIKHLCLPKVHTEHLQMSMDISCADMDNKSGVV